MGSRIDVHVGDITDLRGSGGASLAVDAIVNAANETMLGGGGVDGAIHRAAGPELLAACRAIPEVRPGVRCPTGEARLTPGFRLAARFVVHTVGPVFRGGSAGEPALLASCYRRSLVLARDAGAKTIAFPAISTGIYGYPFARAAHVAVAACRDFLAVDGTFEKIVLVAFDDAGGERLRAAVAAG